MAAVWFLRVGLSSSSVVRGRALPVVRDREAPFLGIVTFPLKKPRLPVTRADALRTKRMLGRSSLRRLGRASLSSGTSRETDTASKSKLPLGMQAGPT